MTTLDPIEAKNYRMLGLLAQGRDRGFANAHFYEIAELAASIDGRMAADPPAEEPDLPPDEPSTSKEEPQQKKSTSKGETEPATPPNIPEFPAEDAELQEWKTYARRNQAWAKKNAKAAQSAEKAAEEKAAAEQAKADADKQNAELRDQLGKLLGFTKDDEPPDPNKLQQALADRERDLKSKDDVVAAKDEEIAARDRTIAARDVELAAWREAMGQGLDAVTLMDLRSTERRLGLLDPTAEDFPKLLTAALTELAEQNPALRINAKVPDAGRAGIGAAGAPDDAAVTPGAGRLRAAYSKT